MEKREEKKGMKEEYQAGKVGRRRDRGTRNREEGKKGERRKSTRQEKWGRRREQRKRKHGRIGNIKPLDF